MQKQNHLKTKSWCCLQMQGFPELTVDKYMMKKTSFLKK